MDPPQNSSTQILKCFYQPFELSFWRHPFPAEDPFVSKSVMLHFSKSVQMKKNSSTFSMAEEEYILSKFSFLCDLFLWLIFVIALSVFEAE